MIRIFCGDKTNPSRFNDVSNSIELLLNESTFNNSSELTTHGYFSPLTI